MFKLNKYFTRTSSRETGTPNESTPLMPRDQRREIGPTQQVSERERQEEARRQEAKGPNPLTGEGMESQKLKAEANGLWKRVRGMDVNRVYVEKLTAAYDQRYDRICSLVMKDKKLTQEVLDCSRNDFLEDLDYLKDTLKKNLSENILKRDPKPEHKARSLKFLEAVADLQQYWEWRLEHADSLEHKGRLEIKELFKSLDENNSRDYLVSKSEVTQSIRVINCMYEEAEGTYTPSEMWNKARRSISKWVKEYNEYSNKFMRYFTRCTWLDNHFLEITSEDIKKLRELGTDIVKFEERITKFGIAGYVDFLSKNSQK